MNYPSDDTFEEARRNRMPPGFKEYTNENSYQNVINYIRHNMEYYETHVHSCCEDFRPGITAQGAVMALKEILEHFNADFSGHKLKCNSGDLQCRCGISQFIVTKVEKSLAYYECKCGNKWTDDEYPFATYCYCPACKKKIDGTQYE